MQGRPRVRARLEQLRFEIDELSKRIDEHLGTSKQYRAIRGSIDNSPTNEQGEKQPPADSGETPPLNGDQLTGG